MVQITPTKKGAEFTLRINRLGMHVLRLALRNIPEDAFDNIEYVDPRTGTMYKMAATQLEMSINQALTDTVKIG